MVRQICTKNLFVLPYWKIVAWLLVILWIFTFNWTKKRGRWSFAALQHLYHISCSILTASNNNALKICEKYAAWFFYSLIIFVLVIDFLLSSDEVCCRFFICRCVFVKYSILFSTCFLIISFLLLRDICKWLCLMRKKVREIWNVVSRKKKVRVTFMMNVKIHNEKINGKIKRNCIVY